MGAVMCVPVTRQDTDFLFLAGRDEGEPAYQLADLDMFGILARQRVMFIPFLWMLFA